jgi:hypothetical protein
MCNIFVHQFSNVYIYFTLLQRGDVFSFFSFNAVSDKNYMYSYATSDCVGFVVHKLSPGQFSLRILTFFFSVSFHQCSKFVFHSSTPRSCKILATKSHPCWIKIIHSYIKTKKQNTEKIHEKRGKNSRAVYFLLNTCFPFVIPLEKLMSITGGPTSTLRVPFRKVELCSCVLSTTLRTLLSPSSQ